MKKILYSNFEGIDDILGDMLNTDSKPTKKYQKKSKDLDFQDLNNTTKNLIKKAINRKTLYKFWNKAVGEKFGKMSFPYGMTANYTMIIACKNAIVAQELILKKLDILEKLQPYVKSLNMTVKDFKFDPKKWDNEYIVEK